MTDTDTLRDEAEGNSPETESSLSDVDLSDAPALRPWQTMRLRQRQPIMDLVGQMEGEYADEENPDFGLLYSQIAAMDEALESLAVDKDAYAEWAVGKDAERRVAALFQQYIESSEMGKA